MHVSVCVLCWRWWSQWGETRSYRAGCHGRRVACLAGTRHSGLKWEASGGHRTKESELPRYLVVLKAAVKGLGEGHFSCGRSLPPILPFSHASTQCSLSFWAHTGE